MFNETIIEISNCAINKVELLKNNKKSFMISSILAGAFIGIGVLTSYTPAAIFDASGSPFSKIIMALTFSIALTLVSFTSTELFTGNNYFMTTGYLNKKIKKSDMYSVWAYTWIGNLIGSIVLSLLFVMAGLASSGVFIEYLSKIAIAKLEIPTFQLFIRAILCNILVCLAIVISNRTKNDAAKILLIFMCIFSFIISGFEHSIANMTVFSIAILSKQVTAITLSKALFSLIIVTFGNMIGGIFFVGYTTFQLKNNHSQCYLKK